MRLFSLSLAACFVGFLLGGPTPAAAQDQPSASAPKEGAVAVEDEPALFCVAGICPTRTHAWVAGGILAGTAAVGAIVAWTVGTRQAWAAAIGFLAFGHFFFDVVPLAVLGVAAWIYGPQVWTWVGWPPEEADTAPAPQS